MSAAWFVVMLILIIWGAGAGILLGLEAHYRRRYREQLEVREWTEKVDAMRRMHDREGDA